MKQGIVEKITNGGWGLVRSDEGVVFLNYVLPGESVTYRIRERARGILWGELIEVLTPSEHRVEPPCPYFGKCGGCVFQHIDYSFQESIKKSILADDLKRIGHFETSIENFTGSPPFSYRFRARMKAEDSGKIGFIRKGTNTVIPINHCLLFPDAINEFLKSWNSMEKPPFFHQLDIMCPPCPPKGTKQCAGGTGDSLPDGKQIYIHLSHAPGKEKAVLKKFPGITFSWKGNEAAGVTRLVAGDFSYYVSPTVFFQVNQFQWLNMLNRVESYLEPCEAIIELYSGVGFFIPLLQRFSKRVIGVENQGFSVRLARKAFPDVEFLKTPAEKYEFTEAGIILLDPPRSGLSSYVMENVLEKKYRKVIYISCSSATYSRDMKILRENGYRLDDLNIFDLFPQTSHLETISLFVRQ
ncbi:MAG: class I SAM-dependent RNA methyltransferase [bacterium]|nr:class I SAM-dependent RNA methyltransferase [bacterium]